MPTSEELTQAAAKLNDPHITEAAKEVIRHDPAAAKDIVTGAGVSRQVAADFRTKEERSKGLEKQQHEAGGEFAPPPSGPTGVTTGGLGAAAAPGSAASGLAHEKNFDRDINQYTRGSECADGPIEPLHLHKPHGDEGPDSKAAHQLDEELHKPHTHPPNAYAPPSTEDRPVKTSGSHHRR